MSQAYTQLIETIHDARRAWRAHRAIEGAVLALAVFIAVTLIAAVIDRLLAPGTLGRHLLGLSVYALTMAAIGRALVRPLMRHHSEDYFAALLEQRTPDLRNRLINAVQLGRRQADTPTPFIEAVVKDGVNATEGLAPAQASRGPALARHAAALAASILLALSFWLAAGPAAPVSAQRVLMPAAAIAPFTWTHVQLALEPDQRVLEGAAVTASITTTGRAVDEARLHWRSADGRAHSARLTPEPDGTFEHRFASVDAPLTVRATAGDGHSHTHTIAIDPRPRIERVHVTYAYPDYTGLPDRRVTDFDGHLQAVHGTTAHLQVRVSEPLEAMRMRLGDGTTRHARAEGDEGHTWRFETVLDQADRFGLAMRDPRGYDLEAPRHYTIHPERDGPPAIAFRQPRDHVTLAGDEPVLFEIVARDAYSLDRIELRGRLGESPSADHERTITTWHTDEPGQTRLSARTERTPAQLEIPPGQRMTLWAIAWDRNDVTGPNRAQTRRLTIHHRQPEPDAAEMEARLAEYVRVLTRLLRDQQRNRAETAEHAPADSLIERQNTIRNDTTRLAERMTEHAFPGRTIIEALHTLAREPMAETIVRLERYQRRRADHSPEDILNEALTLQDRIIDDLEDILVRLTRAAEVRQRLRRAEDEQPEAHREVVDTLEQMAADLDEFLSDVRDLEETYDRLPRRDDPDADDHALDRELTSLDERMTDWQEWFADSVDAITKLPEGFVPEGFLAEELNAIFEEIERQPRAEATEIATPLEEGIKALAEEVKEDFEMWMMHEPDSNRWVMEDPIEGAFEVPDAELPSELQDMIGDLIEEVEDFDEAADDITGAWGGNLQMGWDIADGPISSFAALGKTGNQLPNASEMSGRSGSGRRGRASGQMVGGESRGMEGRPTPARVTAEPYEQGMPEVLNMLDPRGATGGGKLTGAGRRGLQGGLPPDLTRDMQRLTEQQALLRERTQLLARQFNQHGRPLDQLQRAIDLMEDAEQDYRDRRYHDAARQRKAALEALREVGRGGERSVQWSLERARQLPAELREQISSGADQPMPAGYEDLVGAYYQALSEEE